jgi:hypothetical protein
VGIRSHGSDQKDENEGISGRKYNYSIISGECLDVLGKTRQRQEGSHGLQEKNRNILWLFLFSRRPVEILEENLVGLREASYHRGERRVEQARRLTVEERA